MDMFEARWLAEMEEERARRRWETAKAEMRVLNEAWYVRYRWQPPSRELVAALMNEMWAAWEALEALKRERVPEWLAEARRNEDATGFQRAVSRWPEDAS